MTALRNDAILRHLRRLARPSDEAARTDEQLLESFVTRRDEPAFAALLRRHGAMVLGVCRRILGNHDDADDAFQATFLVLVRRAASIRPRSGVAAWLHGVARRTALYARRARARHWLREKHVLDFPEPAAERPGPHLDLRPVLDEGLSRLPEKYRLPIVLCDLEGQTITEAARQLAWPQGTLAGRLARGRKLLAQRLASQGVALSAGALAAALAPDAAAAGVPAALVHSTIKISILVAAGQAAVAGTVPATVAALLQGVETSMAVAKMKLVLTLGVLALGLCGLGGVAAGLGREDQPAPVPKQETQTPDPQRVAALIRQLGDDAFAKREAASKELEAIGVPALAALKKARASDDPEIRRRATLLHQKIAAALQVFCYEGHASGGDGWVIGVAFSPDGKRVLSSAGVFGNPPPENGGSVRLLDARTGKLLRCLVHPYARKVAFSPDGKRAASTGDGGNQTIQLWDLQTGENLKGFGPYEGYVYGVAFTPNGKNLLFAVYADPSLRVLPAKERSANPSLRLLDLDTGKELQRFDAGLPCDCALSADGAKSLTGNTAGLVQLWDNATGKEWKRLEGHKGEVYYAVFSPGEKWVASGGEAGVIKFWDLRTGKVVREINEPGKKRSTCGAFCPDGRRFASGDDDGNIRLWDVETGDELHCFEGHTSTVYALAFSPDGRFLVSGGRDRTVRVWKVPR
jgi:RNA polymerase sigma factor (sigma-70 family)